MIKLSLKTKTIVGIAIIEGALLLLLIYIATQFFADTLNENFRKRADTTVRLFATLSKDALVSYDLATLMSYSEELNKNPDIAYVKVFGPLPQEELFVSLGDEAQLNKEFVEDYSIMKVDDGVFDTTVRVGQESQGFGRVQVGFRVSGLLFATNQLKQWAGTIALIEMILVALFSYVLGSYLTVRLKRLEEATKVATKSIDTGSFTDAKLEVRNYDELGEVVVSFNRLIDALDQANKRNHEYRDELQRMNVDLETLVAKRTEKLQRVNAELTDSYQYVKTAQEQLIQSEKMASMGQMAASLAHEMNNPIAFIQSNIESMASYLEIIEAQQILIADALSSPDDQRESKLALLKSFIDEKHIVEEISDANDMLLEIKSGLQRVVDVIKSMSAFSRVDSEKKQWFNLNRCIESIYRMTQKQVAQKGTLRCTYGDIPDTFINVGKINQVLTNLIINAFDAIDSGGIITVTSEAQEHEVKITVRDDGEGIDDDIQAKIFDPFFTTKKEGKGTGLGLSISYDIIKAHGGKVELDSRVGKGTRVSFTVPVRVPQRHKPEGYTSLESAQSEKFKQITSEFDE